MVRASWNGEPLAESDETVVVEGNHYFPEDAVVRDYLIASGTHTVCPWKGEASYYSIKVGGEVISDAAWYYPEPKSAAEEIRGKIAFAPAVNVEA